MLLFCKHNEDILKHKRFIFEGGTPEGQKVEKKEGGEKKEVTQDDVDKARENFNKEKDALLKKLDGYEKSDNPAIKEAATKAKADLLKLSESGDLTPENINSRLDFIRLTLNYFENKPKLDRMTKTVETKGANLEKKWTDYMTSMSKGMADEYPNLPKDVLAKITALGPEYAEMASGAIQVTTLYGTQGNDVTMDDLFLNPRIIFTRYEAAKDAEMRLDGNDPGGKLWAELNRLNDVMTLKINTIINIEVAKDQSQAEAQVNDVLKGGNESLDEWGKKYNKPVEAQKGQLAAACENALAALKTFNKPGDAQKRALILANLNDQVSVIFSGKPFEKKEGLTTETDAVMKQFNMGADKYFAGFEKGKLTSADAGLKLDEKVKKKDEYYGVIGSPNFRLEGTGAKITSLPPNTELQIVDTNVMQVETSDGQKVNYIKVRLNPPDGPIGYVAQNHVNFTKRIMNLDEKESGSNPQAAA